MTKISVKMIVDRKNLTVKFECNGDVWKWLNKKGNRNSHTAYNIAEYVRDEEVHDFCYETYLDKFVRKYKEKVDEVITV